MAQTTKSRQRIIDHGEVFTPPGLVNDMLDLVAQECDRIDSRFLEPACGNGNFLAEVLRRKLAAVERQSSRNRLRWEQNAIVAVSSLYGIDLLADNVVECRERLLRIVVTAHVEQFHDALSDEAVRAFEFILSCNILQGDALTLQSADGQPIIFSEWSPINGAMLKRRDFAFDHLFDRAQLTDMPLFSDLGKNVYVPTPVRDFPLCHYLKIADAEAVNERP